MISPGPIKKYRRVVEKHPLSREAPQARFRMAELYEARKEPADAFDQYQKLIDRHPDSPLYRQAMARQKEMAFGAASGALTNRVLWMFDVRMDPTNVTEWLKHVRDNAPYAPTAPQAMNVLGNYLAARGPDEGGHRGIPEPGGQLPQFSAGPHGPAPDSHPVSPGCCGRRPQPRQCGPRSGSV